MNIEMMISHMVTKQLGHYQPRQRWLPYPVAMVPLTQGILCQGDQDEVVPMAPEDEEDSSLDGAGHTYRWLD